MGLGLGLANPSPNWLLKAARAAPKEGEVRALLGEAYARSGDHEEAQAAFKSALELSKKKGKKKARVALGRALFMDPRPGKRAVGGQMLTAILHEDMEDEAALQAYGEACIELGQSEDALKVRCEVGFS